MASIIAHGWRRRAKREWGGGGLPLQRICFLYTCSESTKLLPILDNLRSLASILAMANGEDLSSPFPTNTHE